MKPESYEQAKKYNELGNYYKNSHNFKKALGYYQKALKYLPDSSIIITNIGVVYLSSGENPQAKRCFEKAIKNDPGYLEAYYNLGKVYLNLEEYNSAKRCFEKAIKLNPEFGYSKSLLTYTKLQTCDWNNLPIYDTIYDTPLLNIIRSQKLKENFMAAGNWSRMVEDTVAKYPKFIHKKRNTKKLTVGYISNDFYAHATSYLIGGMFKFHNKNRFDIYVYSYGPNNNNKYKKSIKKDVNKFIDISQLSDYQAAKQIYLDKVDILVDLKGYTAGSRMEILALKPAPIQISYLGFPGTTGAKFMDYLITDNIVTPKRDIKYYSEKLIYMPHSYQVNARAGNQVVLRRKRDGKKIVFCCFNQTIKIDKEVFDSWMRILKAVPSSVLWLLKTNTEAEANLRRYMRIKKIASSRLSFLKQMPYQEHLKRLNQADLALDTFIYNGHTTTSDSLWAGVPVVTLKGKHFASRVSASLLSAVGLPELTTCSIKEYEALAVSLANNPNKLSALHLKLFSNRLSKPLFNTGLFVKSLEQAYLKVWHNYTK